MAEAAAQAKPGSSGAGKLFGSGGIAEQFVLWGVVAAIAASLLEPIMQAITQEVFQGLSVTPISPAQAADLVLKGWFDFDRGALEASKAGITKERFQAMVDDAGEPPGLDVLLQAWRRNIIGWDTDNADGTSVLTGIKQSRVRNQWANMIEAMARQVLPVGDVVSAVVKGQISHSLGETIAWYSGINSDDFTILVHTAGNPPGPGELIELARRGLIPVAGTGPDVLSLQQGIYEGMTKDKWYPMYEQLMVYLPPPRTITALERSGVISNAEAQTLYRDSGLSPALAAAYTKNASTVKLAKHKELAEGTVLNLYKAGVIPHAEASTLLLTLGYVQLEADWLLAWEDLRRELATMEKAITRVSTLYVSRKIGETTARGELGSLGLPAAQIDRLVQLWTLERVATVHVLTAAQIEDAFKAAIIDQAAAQTALESLGYDAWDAWLLLSIKMGGALGEAPPEPTQPTGQAP
jgi:hypothetical protein